VTTVAAVRELALTLPRSYEVLVRGRIKFRVGSYVFVAFSTDETLMGFGCPKWERDVLVKAEPEKFLMPPTSDQRYHWAMVRMEAVDHAEMRELVLDAWRMVVPKSVAREYFERDEFRRAAGSAPVNATEEGRTMEFRTTLLQSGKTATGIEVPADVVEALGAGKRPPVRVTINGRHTYRSTVAVMGGAYMVGVSAENRAAANVAGGDEIDVRLELDDAPREVEVPAALAAALKGDATARAAFEALSPSKKKWHTLSVEGAKTEETRARRVAKSLALLRGET
jgi:hypothetical protein